jgi:hypothetical protein
VLPYGEHQAQLRRFVSNARSKLHCIAKRSATGNRSARITLSLFTSAGALALWLWHRKRIRKLQFVELHRSSSH